MVESTYIRTKKIQTRFESRDIMIARSVFLLFAVFALASCQTPASITADSTKDNVAPAVPIALPTVIGTPYPTQGDYPSGADVVSFTKRVYQALGKGGSSVQDIVGDFKREYETLNYDGTLGEKLMGLYEMRLNDLQIAYRHAKTLKEVWDALGAPAAVEEEEEVKAAVSKDEVDATKKETPPLIKAQAAQAALSSAQSSATNAK